MKFPISKTAFRYLTGLQGLEIGGSAHNPFGLNTINVDVTADMNTVFKQQEFNLCGEKLPVDVVASGDDLPFPDKSFDFVVSSHVIEHFFNPIKALLEWQRVASRYIVIICPHKARTFDSERPLTTLAELIGRHEGILTDISVVNEHYSVWDTQSFLDFLYYLEMNVLEVLDVDDKVGNGFLVVIKLESE